MRISTDERFHLNKIMQKIVFFGTPKFSARILEELIASGEYDVCAVVTQVDKEVGRGRVLTPSPVKVVAEKHNIECWTPKSIKKIPVDFHNDKNSNEFFRENKDTELFSFLKHIVNEQPLLFVLVAFGMIIPQSLLDFPKFGFVNIHTSLLPRWRGAAPIHRALFAGDTKTGVSIMKMDAGLDTGGVYKTAEICINEEDNFGDVENKLLDISIPTLLDTLPEILSGTAVATPQTEEGMCYAKKWDGDDFNIKWNETAEVIIRRIKTCSPEFGAKAIFDKRIIKIYDAHIVFDNNIKWHNAGEIAEVNKRELIISVGNLQNKQFIAIDKMQWPGKPVHEIKDILNGYKFIVGDLMHNNN